MKKGRGAPGAKYKIPCPPKPQQKRSGMEFLIETINETIRKEFEHIEELPNSNAEIEKLFRNIRWKEPELAIYIKKKMNQFLKEKAIYKDCPND